MVAMGCKGGPRDMRPVDPMTGRILNVEKPGTTNQQKAAEDEVAEEANPTWNLLYPIKLFILLF